MSGFSADCQMPAGNCEFSESQNFMDLYGMYVIDLRFVPLEMHFNLKNMVSCYENS